MAQRYDLLTVKEDDKGKSWWTKIGAGWENKAGDGFQLIFEALPLPGKDGLTKVIMKQPSESEGRR